MTSRPLLASVAESIVILAPIVQVGWRRACSGVTAASVAGSASRNGPPDAVRTSAATPYHQFADEALPDRRVLQIDRSQPGQCAGIRIAGVPGGRGRGQGMREWHDEVAAGDQRLLVGRGDDLARPERGKYRPQADHAARGDDTRSTSSRVARVSSASAPPTSRVPAGRSRLACAETSARATTLGWSRRACSESPAASEPVARATTLNASGFAARTSTVWRPIDPVEPRRATRRRARSPTTAGSANERDDIEGDDRSGEDE